MQKVPGPRPSQRSSALPVPLKSTAQVSGRPGLQLALESLGFKPSSQLNRV